MNSCEYYSMYIILYIYILWFYTIFRHNTLEMIAKILCNVLIEDSILRHEWMEVLPFLHTIRSNYFSPERPVTLPKDATAVCRIMFCGLDMDQFISRITRETK